MLMQSTMQGHLQGVIRDVSGLVKAMLQGDTAKGPRYDHVHIL
jgi:hypothetical protein